MPFEISASNDAAVARLKQRLSGFETEEGRRKGLAFQPGAGDVFVCTTPKAGTTLMQQVCHQLRTGGDDSFDEISAEGVAPFIELAADCGIALDAQQPAAPRLFKSHCWEPHCPKGARYIIVVRNPHACAVSFYSFFEGWFFEPGEVALEPFVRDFVLARGVPETEMQNPSYWHHLTSWWPRRADSDTLFVCYEDLVKDREAQIRRVAEFLLLPNTAPADLERCVKAALERSSLEWMQAHPTKFDEHISKRARNAACSLAPDAGAGGGKVRAADAPRPVLSEELKRELDARWTDVVAPVTGCATYEDLRAAIAALR